MKLTLLIPMYNESRVIADTVSTLKSYMGEHFEDFEVFFINDGSTDDCAKIAEEKIAELGDDRLRVIGYEVNRGKGAAIRYGVSQSTGDVVIFTDTDLAYGCDVIAEAYDRFAETKPHALIGSRALGENGYAGYTFTRKVASKAYLRVLRLFGGFKLSDSQCGFKCFDGNAARTAFSFATVDRFAFDFEVLSILHRMGARIDEMPVTIINHDEGGSKIHLFRDSVNMLNDLRRIGRRVKKLDLPKLEENE